MEELDIAQWRVCQLCNMMSHRDSRQWLRACQCPQPFHRQCLQYRVWICEALRPPRVPSCPWCGVLYRVKPDKGIVTTALETVAYTWYPNLCQAVSVLTCQVAVDSACTTFGLFILSRVYGFQEAWIMLLDMDPWFAVTICHSLPLTAIVINYAPWEDYLLRFLQRCSSVPVVGAIMPQGGPQLQPLKPRTIYSFGAVVGGLLLPTFAEITGSFLFRSEESPAVRFLLGGSVFLVVRGIFYMYYRQKTFMRQNHLSVANYVPPYQRNVPPPTSGLS